MRRTRRPLAALTLVALISLAGCSIAPAETGAGGSGDTTSTAPKEALTGVTAAGTASSGSTTTSAPASNAAAVAGTAADRQQAVKFAACMRANGVQQFPDPDAAGQLTIDAVANGSSLDTNSTAFKQALSACKDLEPAGFTGAKRSPEQQKAALQFAQCIRENGVKDFPDPAPDAPLVDTNRIPSAARNGGMSMLNAAMRKCRGLAANAGVTGGR